MYGHMANYFTGKEVISVKVRIALFAGSWYPGSAAGCEKVIKSLLFPHT